MDEREPANLCRRRLLVAPAFGDKFNPEAPYDELPRGGMADDTFPELFEAILRNRK